jgi:hypothetical protein
MICYRLLLRRTVFLLAAIGSLQAPAGAQSDPGYLPPGESGPRSIRPPQGDNPGYGQPYSAPSQPPPPGAPGDYGGPPPQPNSYSSNEILDAGHRFFGSVSDGLGRVVEYAFRRQGRPNGYILGEEAGGAIIAGLRYGEGTLYMKGFPPQKVYWQGPSLGYDFGKWLEIPHARLQSPIPLSNLRTIWRRRRFGVFCRRSRANVSAT